MKSLNNKTAEQIKQFISNKLNVPIEDIKLFGSRINGNYTKESDLDIVIIDDCTEKHEEFGCRAFGMYLEYHWVDDFSHTWLNNAI